MIGVLRALIALGYLGWLDAGFPDICGELGTCRRSARRWIFSTALYAMAAMAAVACYVDFKLDQSQQESFRDKLTVWWYWLSEIKWRNFGSREASFAVNVIDKFCGPRLQSWKRMVVSAGIVVILVLSTILIAIIVIPKGPPWQWTGEAGKSMAYFWNRRQRN